MGSNGRVAGYLDGWTVSGPGGTLGGVSVGVNEHAEQTIPRTNAMPTQRATTKARTATI